MPLIKAITVASILFPVVAHAQPDPECLKHLGGAFSGVECYNGLANDLRLENRLLSKKIAATIPKNSKSKSLLTSYMKNEVSSYKFCNLTKGAYAGWQIDSQSTPPRYRDYDVVYFECVYSKVLEQNRFLKKMYEDASR